MIFTEFRFLAFFAIVFSLHWLLRGPTLRKSWLLLASYTFYAAWDWRFLSLIWISTIVDYIAGLRIAGSEAPTTRKRWLQLSLLANLGVLGFFKYYGFFIGSAESLLTSIGFEANLPTLQIILPVGISFFTFQTMSYSLDIYYRKIQPTRSLLDLSLFVGFFPQLVAGPIVRASEFLPQLKEQRTLASVAFKPALLLFMCGFVKKACISDNLAPMVDAYFETPELWTAGASWIALTGYAVQIYCDFSGYSDMAIACAAMLGYRLCLNFDAPYLARDIGDLWRRWHISFSTWLRDYLFIPLGGSRCSAWRARRNLFITMTLGGLWHGASWNFVLWGAFHGLALIVHSVWRKSAGKSLADQMWWKPVASILAVWFFVACLIPFRSPDFETIGVVVQAFLLFQDHGPDGVTSGWVYYFLALYGAHWLASWLRKGNAIERIPTPAFAFGLGILAALSFAFMRVDHPPFIYFQF
ncbi:MAG: MBOAT family protein [Planctomycetes bacterium]|nr:MBOAT family protein [Planctomycetota bacterium]MCP4772161.1 MBOAT family protein [Planctomycetota bacterium]MCP4861378.1 MBOAT family protein [Planctomycetota bacterium]